MTPLNNYHDFFDVEIPILPIIENYFIPQI